MKFKISAEEFDALPDGMKELYGKTATGYQLKVEGLPVEDGAKLKEFRDNNIKLMQKIDELEKTTKRYEGIDPEQVETLKQQAAKLAQLEEQNLLKAGDIDKVVAQRTETMRQDLQRQLQGLQSKHDELAKATSKYKDAYQKLKVSSAVTSAVSKVGALRPGAEVHVQNMANGVFSLDEDDNIVAGDLYEDDGKTPMSVESWGKRLLADHGYLFEAAQGSGASGANKPAPRNQGGAKILQNPSARQIGNHLEDIASGKVVVQN